MARRNRDENVRLNRLIANNLRRKTASFTPVFVECPNKIEVKGEGGKAEKRVCGSILWNKMQLFNLFHVPQVVCQQSGGMVQTKPNDFFRCAACGFLLVPEAWKRLALEAFEAGEKKIVTPDEIKPEDNGGGE